MARIFLSHNSQDALEAVALKRWLADNGWDDVFLDLDARDGLSPGERWKDALRSAADRCEAVLCLVSPTWLASAECKLEFRYAETLRKQVFLAIIKPCAPQDLPPDWQWCPLYGEGAQTTLRVEFREQPGACAFLSSGLQRLKYGLEKAGISAEHFPWPPANDPDRAPYRGLKPLEAADAAVFFGRNAQTLHGMETLGDMRRNGVERLLVILGASGSGKSSFMRAGLLPRLARDDRQFFPLPVIRPRNAVLFGVDGLAPALTAAFAGLGRHLTLGEIETRLNAGPEAVDALLAQLEQRLLERITGEAEPQPPSLVLLLDQAEELFNPDGAAEATTFLDLLGGLLTDRDAGGVLAGACRRALVVLTIRSDRYERLQTAPGLSAVKPRLFDLRPFPPGQFDRVINGPAERATRAGRRLIIEPRLTDRLLADFSEGADTLPLLGFALEKLYHKYGDDGDLTLADYEAIRGRHDTVQAAIFQEAIDSALAEPYRPPVIPTDRPAQEQGLRRAFIPFLAQINEETNEPMRQVANLDDLPTDVHPLVERLVDARLLIRNKDVIEVAHESLLRQWGSLRNWLTEDLDKLFLRDAIRRAAAEWTKGGRREDLLVHRDGRLKDAEALLATPGYVVSADSAERAYLNACTAAQQAREAVIKEEQERRIHDAERIAEEQKRAAAAQKRATRASLIGLAIALLVAGVAGWQWLSARRSEQRAQVALTKATALKLAIESKTILNGSLPGGTSLGLQLALASFKLAPGPDTFGAIQSAENATAAVLWIRESDGPFAFSPDGRRIASGSSDGSLQIWDVAGGVLLGKSLKRHSEAISSIAFSPNGERIVSGSLDKTLQLWDAATSTPLGEPLKGHDGEVWSIAFSPDGSQIVSGSVDRTLRLWDAVTRVPLGKPLKGHGGTVVSVAFSPDGSQIVSGSVDRTLRRWDAASHSLLGTPLQGHEGEVVSVAYSPDGKLIVSGGYDSRVCLWNAAMGVRLLEGKFERHTDGVQSVAFSPDGNRIISGSWDTSIRLWEASTGEPIGEPLVGHTDRVWSAAFSPDGQYIGSRSADGTLRLWNAGGGLLVGHLDAVTSVAFSQPDGKHIFSGGYDRTVRLWDVSTGQSLGEPLQNGHTHGVTSIALSPDGQRIASGGMDGTVLLHNVVTGVLLGQSRRAHSGQVWSLAFSPDGKLLASGSWDSTVRLWDGTTGVPIAPSLTGYDSAIFGVAFSPDGKRIVSGSWSGTLLLQDAATGAIVGRALKAHAGVVSSVAFSPDGRRIVSGGHDHTLRLWDGVTASPLGEPLKGHSRQVTGVAFSPDGRRIVSGDHDQTLRLWDAATGTPLGEPLKGHHGEVFGVGFSPDSTRIVSGSKDTTIRLWRVGRPEHLCARLGRNLSSAEWRQYVGDIPYVEQCPGLPVD